MKLPIHARHFILFTVLLLVSVQPGFAQEPDTLTAKVDRTALTTDETVTLTVTVNAAIANPSQPMLPTLKEFDVVGTSTSTQVNIINGAVKTQTVYRYHLQPNQVGRLVIGAITLTLNNGQSFATRSITIHVSQGVRDVLGASTAREKPSGPAGLAGQNLFVEAKVDHLAPYVGQQVIYAFRLYQATSILDQPRYIAPAFNGFWLEEQPGQIQYTTRMADQLYHVTELRTILFPTVAQTTTIDPAKLIIRGRRNRPDIQLETNPVILTVQPLPDGAPAGFNGAVGHFTLLAEVDTLDGKVNEPITLRVTLNGQSNMNTSPDPVWPDMPGWRAFDSQATLKTQFEDDQFGGSRIYERILIPETEGRLTIPPITYTYFDPLNVTYQTIETVPIEVWIEAGEVEPPPPLVLGAQKTLVKQLATDIRHLKPVPPVLRETAPPLTAQSRYWLAWGLPIFILLSHLGWQRRQRYRQNNANLIRSAQAYKKAMTDLNAVTPLTQTQGSDLYMSLNRVLMTYLSAKLNRSVAGLTQTALTQLLSDKGIPTELVGRVKTCLRMIEAGRFAPEAHQTTSIKRLLDQVGRLLGDLEQAF